MITRRALLASLPLLAQDKTDKATIDRWMKELSNWGRWGKDDQLGAVNLITAAKRKQAVALVREGVPVSLSRVSASDAIVSTVRPNASAMPYTWMSWPAKIAAPHPPNTSQNVPMSSATSFLA